jgi:tRNA threonylcarbamoyladenosine biosynthesis protein TsaE
MIFETTSSEETIELGKRLGTVLSKGAIIAFFGDLGSGKTTMIKGVAQGLGVKELVKSPSFVVVTEYQGRLPVYHIDLYRISKPSELPEVGFEQYLYGDGVSLIEWAERAENLLPINAIKTRIEILGQSLRKVTIANFNLPI